MEEPKKTRARFERNSKYDTVDIQDRVVKLRKYGLTWDKITDIVKEEISEPTMSSSLTKNLYNRALARTITTEKRVGKKFKDYTDELDKMFGQSIRVLEGYITAAEKVTETLKDMVEDGDITAIKAYGIILKTAPQMKAITSEIRDFMRLQQEQQEKIKIEQSALVWDESQMIDYLNTYLKRLEKEGTVKLLKQIN